MPDRAKTPGLAAATLAAMSLLGSGIASAALPKPSHALYVRLYKAAVVGKTRIAVIKQWPKPYQDYHDGTGNRCLEWIDRAPTHTVTLYDLCFKKSGVLVSKQKP